LDRIVAEVGDQIMREAKERVEKLAPAASAEDDSSQPYEEQWLVLVRCEDEGQQLNLLERLTGEGLNCSAMNR
jgi:hypothetical protein